MLYLIEPVDRMPVAWGRTIFVSGRLRLVSYVYVGLALRRVRAMRARGPIGPVRVRVACQQAVRVCHTLLWRASARVRLSFCTALFSLCDCGLCGGDVWSRLLILSVGE